VRDKGCIIEVFQFFLKNIFLVFIEVVVIITILSLTHENGTINLERSTDRDHGYRQGD
jgi:hypothetical protein